MVVANHIAELSQQFSRRIPSNWGAMQCYDPDSSPIVAGGWGELDYINIDSTAYFYDHDDDNNNANIISDT